MPKQPDSKLHFIPFKPTRGVFHKHRARGAGVAIALAELLSKHDFPISIMNVSPAEAEDPSALLLQGELADREWAAVGGYYNSKELSPLKLVVVPPSATKPAGEREFDFADDENLDGFIGDLREWLEEFGEGERAAPVDPLTPATPDQLVIDSWFYGLEWLVDEITTVVDKEFLQTLRETLKFFSGRLGDPYADRRLRELVLLIIDPMQAKRFPEGEDDDTLTEAMSMLTSQMNAAGTEDILPVLDEGVERGADPAAFHAARGYALLALDRAADAVEDFEAVEKAGHARPALFGLGRAYVELGETDKATRALDRAIKTTKPGEPFNDIVRGTDAAPEPDGRTWLGMLLAARGQAELSAGDFAAAEKSLRRALEEGTDESDALELLAAAYGEWATRNVERKPAEAKRLFKEQAAALERLYELSPRPEVVEDALSAADFLGDAALAKRWERRREESGA